MFAFPALCLEGLGLSVGSGCRPSSLPGIFWRNWATASLLVILGAEDFCEDMEKVKGHWGDFCSAGCGGSGWRTHC